MLHEDLTDKILAAACEVRKRLTPGYLESIYEKALIIELTGQNMNIELRNRLLQLMTDKENAESVLQMMNLSNEWLSAVIKKYVFLPLESFFNKRFFLFHFCNI